MFFKKISINNYRNFNNLRLELSPNVNILVGQNGQGKTNFIEALYISIYGESFRYGENSDLIKKNSEIGSSILKSEIQEIDFNYDIKLELLKSKKNYFLNEKRTSVTNLQAKFPIIIFSPESLSAIKEGADQRRVLVDQLLITFDPENYNLISNYKKVLKVRNKILKNYKDKKSNEKETLDLLKSVEDNFLKLAVDLTYKRKESLKNILPEINFCFNKISHLPENVDISVEYVASDYNILNLSKENIANLIKKRLFELEKIELSTGASLVGPHKHDISFLTNGNNSRFYFSQGQQRALIIAFKMAQIVYHRKVQKNEPVLMLDDVLSELDPDKRSSLLTFLKEINTQVFITTTDLGLPEKMKTENQLKYTEYFVENGNILERSSI